MIARGAVLLMIVTSLFSDGAIASEKADVKQVAAVRKILREVPLIDGHNDLPWQFRKRSNDLSAINLEVNN